MLVWIHLNLGKGVWHTVQFVITALVLSQETQDVVLWKQSMLMQMQAIINGLMLHALQQKLIE